MNPFALISLLSFVICVFLTAFVYNRNAKATLNRLFVFLSLTLSVYAFLEFGYRQSHSYEEAYFWCRIDRAFWPVLMVAVIYFLIGFLDKTRLLKNILIQSLICLPAIAFIILDMRFNLITGNPVKQYWGWSYSAPLPNLSYFISNIWICSIPVVGFVFVARMYFRATDSRKRNQCKLVGFALIIPILAIFGEILLRFVSIPIPPLSISSFVIFNLCIAYAIWKYELFALTPMTAAESIVTTMSDALLLVNPDLSIASGNRAAETMLGYNDKDLYLLPIASLFSDGAKKPTWISGDGHDLGSAEIKYFETGFVSKRGSEIPVSMASSVLFDDRGNQLGYLIIARDIAERIAKDKELDEYRQSLELLVDKRTFELDNTNKALEHSRKQHRLLGERLALAKEKESAHIARELHDELGQLLTSVKIDVALLGKRIEKDNNLPSGEYTKRADGILGLVDGAIQSVQGITKRLRPAMLDDIGLVDTVEHTVRELMRRTDIQVAFESSINDEDLDPAFATAVYRIVQESLTNITRHAKAKNAWIRITEDAGTLKMEIRDNGIGIPKENKDAFGLLGMNERAHNFGGKVEVKNAQESGTVVDLAVPIKRIKKC
ncbi:MAG: PAS domain S-box protein [Deltaproteobacteria bacterium]|nr:PAS domain S-box protein [Deltaproteobacteria bacterium]